MHMEEINPEYVVGLVDGRKLHHLCEESRFHKRGEATSQS